MSALLPAAMLLAWSALAATAVTGLIAAPLLGEPLRGLALAPRQPTTGSAIVLGLAGYPLCYALGFVALGAANFMTGALLGCVHAAVLALLSLHRGGGALLRANARRALLCVLYGAVLGFAFVMP